MLIVVGAIGVAFTFMLVVIIVMALLSVIHIVYDHLTVKKQFKDLLK